MPADYIIGDNYELSEDDSGNLVIKDATGTIVAQHTDGGGWAISDITTLTGENGAGVYDDATETLGDGTTSADHESVSTDAASITDLKETNLQQLPTDVSGSRTINTTYQNTTENTWYLYILLDASASGTSINAQLTVSQTNTGANVQDNEVDTVNDTFGDGEGDSLTSLVPPGYYYRVRASGDTTSYAIRRVRERDMTA